MIPPVEGSLYVATGTRRPRRVHTAGRRALIRDVAFNPDRPGVPLDRVAAAVIGVVAAALALLADRGPLTVLAALVVLAAAAYHLISRRRSIPRHGRQRDEARVEAPPGSGLASTASVDSAVGGRWAHTET